MDERGAVTVVSFVAIGLIGMSLLEVGFYCSVAFIKKEPLHVVPCVLWGIPFLAGVVMLVKVKALARWLCDKLD